MRTPCVGRHTAPPTAFPSTFTAHPSPTATPRCASEERGEGCRGQDQRHRSPGTPHPQCLLPGAPRLKCLSGCPLCFHHLFSSSVEMVCL